MMALYSLYIFSPWTLLFLRVALGVIFITHGLPKLKNTAAVAGAMHMSTGFIMLVGLIETIGGTFVAVGLLTQLAAIGIAAVMCGALYLKIAKWNAPFSSLEKLGWEFDLILLTAALLIATTGGGMLALDWMLFSIA